VTKKLLHNDRFLLLQAKKILKLSIFDQPDC